jgi:acyl-CoA synthetase (AMP-forming)/AMP-acid ligase II
MNIGMLLELAAEGMPDRVAVGSRADGVSYRQLLERARCGAAVVRARGVERVGLVDTNSPTVPLLLYAGALAGVPFTAVTTGWPTTGCGRSSSGWRRR